MFSYLFLGFDVFFLIVGSFTLTVGGIGVANIMYIVVKERTKEIGIKRSLGARKTDILRQFFFESTAIVMIGALIGFGISVGIVKLMGFLPIREFVGAPIISPQVAWVTMGLLDVRRDAGRLLPGAPCGGARPGRVPAPVSRRQRGEGIRGCGRSCWASSSAT